MGESDWRRELQQRLSGEIHFDEPADRYTSLGVGGSIDALVFPENATELADAVAFLQRTGIAFTPVGNWTNLIVRGGGYRGVCVSLARLRNLTRTDRGDGEVWAEAEAGVPLPDLVVLSVRRALTGMEFCAGIPGSVGGALRMNAGAYGAEIKDVCAQARLLAPGGIRTEPRETLRFTYRILDLPTETIIIGGTFRLTQGEPAQIAGRVRDILAQRRDKHPLEFRNAGSIFKNPRSVPAGRLIEAAGLKGLRIGDAQVSEKHGNFIVNRGRATAEEIVGLIGLVQERVFAATGEILETEVKIIGEAAVAGSSGEMRDRP